MWQIKEVGDGVLLGADRLIPAQTECVCPFGLCQLDVLDQWNWRRAAGGRGARRVCEQDDNSASPAWGAKLILSPSPSPFVLSITDIQTQLCTCMRKHSKVDTHMPVQIHLKKHLHTRTHTLFLRWGRSSCYLNAILLWQACWPVPSSASFIGFSDERG